MNFHSDEWIMEKIREHYNEALESFPEDRIVGIFYQGSGNYGLDYEGSDVDTKLIVTPTFKEIAMNKNPVSTTHIRANDEHTDWKDIRLYIQTFRKQNLNFLEILFTPYKIINPMYEEQWNRLVEAREEIAHYSPIQAIKSMKGIAKEKYFAMEHHYPSRMEWINKYGYDCYHPDTLFLTKRGWLKYDDILDTDELATCNPKTLGLEWQNILNRIKKSPSSQMYQCETYDTCFCVTETHNIFSSQIKNVNTCGHTYNPEATNWDLKPLNECFKNKHRHILSFPINNNEDNKNFSDDILKLFGAFISEGTIGFRDKQQKEARYIRICQTPNGKQDFFEMMDSIREFNIKKYKYENRKEYSWNINDTKLATQFVSWGGHGSKNKHLPDWIYSLSKRQASILLYALYLGDGTEHKSRYIYYTSSKQLAIDVCTLANLAGYASNVMGGDNGYYSNSDTGFGDVYMWQVQISKRNSNHYAYFDDHTINRNGNFTKVKSPDTVVCFTVPNGTLITMYNGKTAVQGNCKQIHHLLRVEEYIQRYISGESYEDCLNSQNPEYLKRVKSGEEYGNDIDLVRNIAKSSIDHIDEMCDEFLKEEYSIDKNIDMLLDDVQYEIMKIAIKKEIGE